MVLFGKQGLELLTDEHRGLLEDFDDKVGPDAYASPDDEDEGFFRRLKSALR